MNRLSQFIPPTLKQWVKSKLYPRSLWVSQAGQDFWVANECFNRMRGGYFLDIGAHDGFSISNTLLLEKQLGWTGICVEANPETFAVLRSRRSALCINVCLDANNGEVEFALGAEMGGIVSHETDNLPNNTYRRARLRTRVVKDILSENKAPEVIDYLSIDVEGAEERVLSGMDWSRYRFNCITIERPSEKVRQKLFSENYLLIRDLPGLDAYYVHRGFIKQYMSNSYAFWNNTKMLSINWI